MSTNFDAEAIARELEEWWQAIAANVIDVGKREFRAVVKCLFTVPVALVEPCLAEEGAELAGTDLSIAVQTGEDFGQKLLPELPSAEAGTLGKIEHGANGDGETERQPSGQEMLIGSGNAGAKQGLDVGCLLPGEAMLVEEEEDHLKAGHAWK